jgi:hypothetical protein
VQEVRRLKVNFHQWSKLCLGLDVEAEIQIMNGFYARVHGEQNWRFPGIVCILYIPLLDKTVSSQVFLCCGILFSLLAGLGQK